MAIVTASPPSKNERITVAVGSDQKQLLVQENNVIGDFYKFVSSFLGSSVLTATALSRGTTSTLATTACTVTINGVPVLIAAQSAQALGALGTIPANLWGIITVETVAAGTITFVSGAANYSTGYASETAAIAAIPAISANKCRIGYFTVQASASTWIAGTDSLAGGGTGNPATTTNYYPTVSIGDTTVLTSAQVFDPKGNTPTYP